MSLTLGLVYLSSPVQFTSTSLPLCMWLHPCTKPAIAKHCVDRDLTDTSLLGVSASLDSLLRSGPGSST